MLGYHIERIESVHKTYVIRRGTILLLAGAVSVIGAWIVNESVRTSAQEIDSVTIELLRREAQTLLQMGGYFLLLFLASLLVALMRKYLFRQHK